MHLCNERDLNEFKFSFNFSLAYKTFFILRQNLSSNNLNLQEFLLKLKKTNGVNNNKEISIRFKEKMCSFVQIFIATFFRLSN
jgi:hypothetical protein